MRLPRRKLISPVTLLLVIIAGGAIGLFYAQKTTPEPAAPSLPAKLFTTREETFIPNPDGTKKLIQKTEKQPGGTTIYTFFTSDIEGGNQKNIYTRTTDTSTVLSIPANTWSPGDNTYVFLSETGPGGTRYIVLKSSGLAFSDTEPYLDVVALFTARQIKYRVSEVTGWDASQLLHVRTMTEEGGAGPSFWFNVETRAFLQLAS